MCEPAEKEDPEMRSIYRWAFVAMGAALLLSGCTGPAPAPPRPGEEIGIEVLGIELRAGGNLAQVNYRVLDYETARRALQKELRLLGGESGAAPLPVTSVGRLGPMRQRPSRSARQQFVIFTNTGRVLQRGSTASFLVGETRIDGIPVT
jgi:hypothetical protein